MVCWFGNMPSCHGNHGLINGLTKECALLFTHIYKSTLYLRLASPEGIPSATWTHHVVEDEAAV